MSNREGGDPDAVPAKAGNDVICRIFPAQVLDRLLVVLRLHGMTRLRL